MAPVPPCKYPARPDQLHSNYNQGIPLPVKSRIGHHERRHGWYNPNIRPIDTHCVSKSTAPPEGPDSGAEIYDFYVRSLEERARQQAGGPFTVDDLSKRVLKGGFPPSSAKKAGNLWERVLKGASPPSSAKKLDFDGFGERAVTNVNAANDPSTSTVNDFVARMGPEHDYKEPLICRNNTVDGDALAAECGEWIKNTLGRETPAMQWIMIFGVTIASASLLAIIVWVVMTRCRSRKRNRALQPRRGFMEDIPKLSQTLPEDDLERSFDTTDRGPGPAIADQLPVEDVLDRPAEKRVSFSFPDDDEPGRTIVKDFQDVEVPDSSNVKNSRDEDEPGNTITKNFQEGEAASPPPLR